MSTLKVDTIATRSGSGNITASNTIVGNLTGNVTGNLTGNSTVGGTLGVTGNSTITSGNLIIATAGKGIDFSATGDGAGTDSSELFDDYEEGTFTPTFRVTGSANSFNYSQQTGRYTKIGNRIFGMCRVTTSGHTGTGGGVSITGFPYTAYNETTSYHHITFGHITGFSYTGTAYGYINSNQVYGDFYVNNNGSLTALTYPNGSGGGLDIITPFMYETA